MSQEPQYRLYIDESGDHTLQVVDDDNRRYLGLIGIWFDWGAPYRTFARELQELKDRIFGPHPDDDRICFHRKDIVERRGVFGRLRDPALNQRFERELLDLVEKASFWMSCVVVDKNLYISRTERDLFNPYHHCIAALLERYGGWLDQAGAKGDVMAESRGSKEDQQLRHEFESTTAKGTSRHSAEWFQRVLTSSKIKLKKKEHDIAGLQLADLLAYPLKREIVAEQRGKLPRHDFSARLLEAARPKMSCRPGGGSVSGYGKVWLE
jgi:hypothetical protein